MDPRLVDRNSSVHSKWQVRAVLWNMQRPWVTWHGETVTIFGPRAHLQISNANVPDIRCNVWRVRATIWDLPSILGGSRRCCGCNVTQRFEIKLLFRSIFFTFHSLFSPFLHLIFSFFRGTEWKFLSCLRPSKMLVCCCLAFF